MDLGAIEQELKGHANQYSAFVFPQVNALGLLENVDALTDFCQQSGVRSIASIDPYLLASGGLKPPVEFGEQGADFIVGDAQHLAIGANFGGPDWGCSAVATMKGTSVTLAHSRTLYWASQGYKRTRLFRDGFIDSRTAHSQRKKRLLMYAPIRPF